MMDHCRDSFDKFPDADRIRYIDPYHLDVANFLEQEGLLPEGTATEWKHQFDELVEKYGKVAYADRDPFVDEWVAKQRGLEASSERDGETPKAKAAREGE